MSSERLISRSLIGLGRPHRVSVGLVGHLGMVRQELLECAHELTPSQAERRPIDFLSGKGTGAKRGRLRRRLR
jgi:hypothetical protein